MFVIVMGMETVRKQQKQQQQQQEAMWREEGVGRPTREVDVLPSALSARVTPR